MSRITFHEDNASKAANFAELFSDSGRASWYQLWTDGPSVPGSFVDTSAYSTYGDGWIRSDDLDRLEVDFSQAGDTLLYVRPWDGSSTNEGWEHANIDFSYASSNYITTGINQNTPMDQMFTDLNTANDMWYRLWIGNAEGTKGSYVDTTSVNNYGRGWVRPEKLSDLSFSLSDAGQDLWVQTWIGQTGVKTWDHWTVGKIITVDDVAVSEAAGTATFSITLPEPVPEGKTLEVQYATVDGTATSENDFTSVTGSLTFQENESEKQVQISITDDTTTGEESETFQLKITNSESREYIDEAFGTCTIADNDDAGDGDPSIPVIQGNEFQINTETSQNQKGASVSAFSRGGFVTVWESQGQDGSGYGVYGQMYDGDGMASGQEFAVNTYTEDHQLSPDTVSLPGGGFVVVWQSLGQDGSGYGIYGQMYDSEGSAAGDEFRINTAADYNQSSPSAAALSGGGFVVAWDSAGQDGSGSGVYARRYDSEGSAVEDEFLVNTTVSDNQSHACALSLTDGKFVVLWSSDNQDGSGSGIFGQIYAADGTASGEEFQVNTTTDNDQTSCAGTGLADGGFVAVWTSNGQDTGGKGVYGQRFADTGEAIGEEFSINTYTVANQESPSVVSLADGGFMVAWESYGQDGSLEGIYGQLYNGSGNTVSDEFRINTTTDQDQDNPDTASLHDLGFVTVWDSQGQDGSAEGVFGQIHSVDTAQYESLNTPADEMELLGTKALDIDTSEMV